MIRANPQLAEMVVQDLERRRDVTAEPEMREKIFANMSKRAADMMRDDLEVKGPVRLSEVDAAQKEIMATARRLADAGQISLATGGEEFV